MAWMPPATPANMPAATNAAIRVSVVLMPAAAALRSLSRVAAIVRPVRADRRFPTTNTATASTASASR